MKKLLLSLALLLTFAAAALADSPAAYPGGDEAMKKYLAENTKYPEPARQNDIEGIVNVSFTVNADGSVGSIKIVRMIDPDLEQEAIRLVKNMPAWTPAEKDGKPVDSTVTVAIPFTLN